MMTVCWRWRIIFFSISVPFADNLAESRSSCLYKKQESWSNPKERMRRIYFRFTQAWITQSIHRSTCNTSPVSSDGQTTTDWTWEIRKWFLMVISLRNSGLSPITSTHAHAVCRPQAPPPSSPPHTFWTFSVWPHFLVPKIDLMCNQTRNNSVASFAQSFYIKIR